METLFLGHEAKYWLELEKKAEKLDVIDFIAEIAKLRGKIDFYESRIKQMYELTTKITS